MPDPAGARAPAAAPRQAKAKAAPGGAVLRLLRSGRTLRLLTISNVLTSVVDLTWTIRSVMALQRLGMGPAEYGVWESVNGVVRLASGYDAPVLHLTRPDGGVERRPSCSERLRKCRKVLEGVIARNYALCILSFSAECEGFLIKLEITGLINHQRFTLWYIQFRIC